MAETVVRERGIQFSSNVFVNVAVFVASFFIGILLVPFFIDELGVAAYGLIPLATSATMYIVVIADSMGAAMSRFFTATMNKDDLGNANRVYSTAVVGVLILVVALIPVMIVLAWLSPTLFDTASVPVYDVRFFFMAIFLSMLVNIAGYGFTSVLFAKNRLDYTAGTKLIQIGLQTVLIILFFNIYPPSLINVGLAYVIASIIAVLFNFVLSKKVFPSGRAKISGFDRCTFREMMSLGAWEVVDRIGLLLFLQASLIIANPLLGATEAGKFAVLVTILAAASTFSSTILSALRPITYLKYEEGKIDEMVKICASGSKIVGLLLAMPVAFLCVFSSQIFLIWIGPGFEELSTAVWIMLFVLLGHLTMSTIIPISTSYFKVRARGIATVVLGALNICLAVIFTVYFEMGITGIAVAWAISMILKSWVFIPWYHAKLTNKNPWVFHKQLVFSIIFFVSTAAIGFLINEYLTISASIITLAVMLLVWYVVYLFIAFRTVISRSEKDLLLMCLPGRLKKIVAKIIA